MSEWTHVNGNIRIDAASRKQAQALAHKIKELLGRQSSDNNNLADEEKYAGEYTLPEGSEGTISYNISVISEERRSEVEVTLFGDLRDFGYTRDAMNFGGINGIKRWFTKLLFEYGFYVRNAILCITVDGIPITDHYLLLGTSSGGEIEVSCSKVEELI